MRPFVAYESELAQLRVFGGAHAQDHFIGLDRIDQPVGRGSGEQCRAGIGGGGVGAPHVAIEHREDLRGEIAPLRQQQPRALAAIECRRSEEHTSELQSLMRISYAVFCLQKNKEITTLTYEYRILT